MVYGWTMKRRFRQWYCGVFRHHPDRETIFKNNTSGPVTVKDIVSERCMRCRKRLQ